MSVNYMIQIDIVLEGAGELFLFYLLFKHV